MDHSIFGELSLIVAISAGISFLMKILKQPLIIGYIIAGVIAGPLVFDIVHAKDTVDLFAMIGIALLLFIIGLGLNPKVIKELGRVAFITAGVQMLVIASLGIATSLMFSTNLKSAIIIGIAISFSSTIIALKIISDKKEQTRLYGRLAIGLLLVQDIAATIVLLLLSTSHGDGFTMQDATGLLLKGLLLGGGLFAAVRFILTPLHKQISNSQEFLFLFAIGWGLGMPAIFEMVGFSFEVGALFAGVALSTQNYAQEVSAKLRPLRDFFIVLFFINLGTNITLDGLVANIPLIFSLSLIVLILEPIVVMSTLGYLGYTKSTSFQTGITTSQVSEFSIVFITLAHASGMIPQSLVSAIIIVSLITIAVSTYMMQYSESFLLKYGHRISLFEHRNFQKENNKNKTYDAIIFGYRKGGSQFMKTFKSMGKSYVLIDYDPSVTEILEKENQPYIYGDATDMEMLDEINIDKAKIIVSTFTDHPSSLFLVKHIHDTNSKAIIILHADKPKEAEELYEAGATYVMLPHFIGSEKLSSFIKRKGLKKSEFVKVA